MVRDDDRQVRLFHNTGDTVDATAISVIVDSDDLDRTEVDGGEFPNDEISSQDSVYFGLDENDERICSHSSGLFKPLVPAGWTLEFYRPSIE